MKPLLTLFSAFLLAGCAHSAPPEPAAVTNLKRLEDERTPDKLLARGRAFANVGDLTRAEQYLSGALEAGGSPQVILPILLRVCVEARRYHVAIDYAVPYLRKHPEDHPLRFVVASLEAQVGEYEEARKDLELIVAQAPREANVHYALAVLLRDHVRDAVKSDEHFREYLRQAPLGAHAEEARSSLLHEVP